MTEQLKSRALDLTQTYPRSPRETLGGYVLAARMLDKCRAVLAGTNGEYKFDCRLDRQLLDFSGIDPADFRDFVASGASDEEVDQWIREHARQTDASDVVIWNNRMRDLRLSDLPVDAQVFLEEYIPQVVPRGRIVYRWFDVYDLEEGRM